MSEGRKRDTPEADWEIRFEDASALRLIVTAVATVMPRVIFKVTKRPNGLFFLCVDGADTAHTCCVSARLQLDHIEWAGGAGETDGTAFTFCVECKHVLTAICPSSSSGALTMQGHSTDATVRIMLRDPDEMSHMDESTLSTFADGDGGFQLIPMEFEMLLEMDVCRLRDMIKKARESSAEVVDIRVFIESKGVQTLSLVTFTVKGDNQEHGQKFYNEINHHDDGSMIVRAAADEGEASKSFDPTAAARFDHGFPVDKIESFIKNVPTRMMVGKIKQGLPMMLSHNLKGASDDTQHIRFLVAPLNEDCKD